VLNELNMMLFDIEGKAEVRNAKNSSSQGKKGRNSTRSVQQSDMESEEKGALTSPDPLDEDGARVVSDMNEEAETICDRIERGVKKLLPPYVTVQANIQFERGSLLVTGTVAVFAWAGSVVLEAAKGEIQQQVANLVKLVVERVINRAVVSRGLQSNVASMEMSVTPHQFAVTSPAERAVAKTMRSTPTDPSSARTAFPILRHVYALYVLFAFVFLAQVILTLGRYFTIRLR
jgi:hypothetical protein